MRLTIPRCPECETPAVYILESMLVHFEIELSLGGAFEYTGQSEDFCETAEPVERDGTITVGCENGHEWQTPVEETAS
ncbi:MAG: hypothetical protein ACRD1X_13770 [Vicinamibacteria bacterium]